jgi:hypothetical protein
MADNTIPLNRFRLVTKTLDSGSNLIYQKDEDLSTIILSAGIANISENLQIASVQIQKSGSLDYVTVIHNAYIPVNETLNPFPGKIILERNDSLYVNTSESGSLEIVLSVLENANN